MIKVYLARGMTGRKKSEVVAEAAKDRDYLRRAGFIVLDPVEEEGVKAGKGTILASKKQMDEFWKRDKELIREANLVFDMTPLHKSEGVQHEIAYARYFLWKPVVRVFPLGKLPPASSISFYEDDCVVDSLDEAIEYSLRVHETWFKRFNWRLRLYRRCYLKACIYKFLEWFR